MNARPEQPELIERFAAALARRSASCEVIDSPAETRLRLAGRLQEEGVKRILAWAPDQLPVEGVLETLAVLGIEAVLPDLRASTAGASVQETAGRRQALAAFEPIDTGLTGAEAGFAASGTLALTSGPGRARLASQLPRRHLVLLPVSRLYPTMADWLADQRRQGRVATLTQPAEIAFITGPSRTLDIEFSPAFGVHGPRQLHVILFREPERSTRPR